MKLFPLLLSLFLCQSAFCFDKEDWAVRCWSFENRLWETQDLEKFTITKEGDATKVTNTSGIHKHAHFTYPVALKGDFTFTIELKGGYELGFLNRAGKDEMLYLELDEQKDFETYELSRKSTRFAVKRNGRERPLVHFRFDYGEDFVITLAIKDGESALIRNYTFRDDSILVAAHRGGYRDDKKDSAPENSTANVALAISKGFDVYETDIRCTADGKFVIIHDDTLDRETYGTGPVENLTFAEVKNLKKRYRDGTLSDFPVASLEELLTAGKGRIGYKADLKKGVLPHFPELAALIHRLGMQDDVYLRTGMSDAAAIQKHFSDGVPKVEMMFKANSVDQVEKIHTDFAPATIQINIAKGEKPGEKKLAAIRTAVELGMLVETHSYSDPSQTRDLIEAGVRMFHTAMPDDLQQWLTENSYR